MSSAVEETKTEGAVGVKTEIQPNVDHSEKLDHHEVLTNKDLMNEAIERENEEHEMGVWEAAKSHPKACIWAFIFCFTIVMESFDMFLNTNFVALTYFKQRFGVKTATGEWSIPTRWQSALFQSGQCGAFFGVFAAGPVTNRLGYRWATILALILMNATIFISFFSTSLGMMVAGQLLEGIPWGFFIANSPAYASEVVPLSLRGATTATLQMSWSIGSIIVSGASYAYNNRMDQWSWRVPTALQWLFPVSFIHLQIIFFFFHNIRKAY